MITLPKEAIDFIIQFEGLQLCAYEDQNGIWTVGYGSTGGDIKENTKFTLEEAKNRLLKDLDSICLILSKWVKAKVNENQVTALLSFVYNIGAGNFHNSSVLKYLNECNYTACAEAFLLWNKVGLQINRGLVRRRQAERTLFLTPMPPLKTQAIV